MCTNGHRGARGWGLSWGCAIRGRLVAGNIARSQEGLEKGVQTSMAQGQSTKITMIKWIRTSRLSTKNSLSQEGMDFPVAGRLTALAAQRRHCQDAPDRLSERSKVRVQGLGFRVQGDFTGKNLECIVVGLRCGSAPLLCTHTQRERERERERELCTDEKQTRVNCIAAYTRQTVWQPVLNPRPRGLSMSCIESNTGEEGEKQPVGDTALVGRCIRRLGLAKDG